MSSILNKCLDLKSHGNCQINNYTILRHPADNYNFTHCLKYFLKSSTWAKQSLLYCGLLQAFANFTKNNRFGSVDEASNPAF